MCVYVCVCIYIFLPNESVDTLFYHLIKWPQHYTSRAYAPQLPVRLELKLLDQAWSYTPISKIISVISRVYFQIITSKTIYLCLPSSVFKKNKLKCGCATNLGTNLFNNAGICALSVAHSLKCFGVSGFFFKTGDLSITQSKPSQKEPKSDQRATRVGRSGKPCCPRSLKCWIMVVVKNSLNTRMYHGFKFLVCYVLLTTLQLLKASSN